MDNSGAVNLARDRKSCNKSRHVDRRFFKVRELQALHQVEVKFVPTDQNAADVLTKPVSPAAFARHSATLMGEGRAST